MVRKILAVLAGLAAAVVVIGAIEMTGHLVYAPPGNLDRNDPAAVRAFVASLPVGAFVSVLVAYVAGTFAGGWVAARVARADPARYVGIVASLVLAAALANIVAIPHPAWFIVALLIVIPAAAILAIKAASRQLETVNLNQ